MPLISWIRVHIKISIKAAVISLILATELFLLEMAKIVPAKRSIGKTYAIRPNTPKKKELIAAPTTPPTPKFAIKIITERARKIRSIASLPMPLLTDLALFLPAALPLLLRLFA